MTGLQMRVGATSDDQLDLIQSGRRKARGDLYQAKDLANRYGDEIRKRYPKHSPARFGLQSR